MEKQLGYCDYCGEDFELEHGNSRYCCGEHRDLARKFRQTEKYQGISSLLPILHRNHELLDTLYSKKLEDFSAEDLEAEGLDFSLFRRLYPERDNRNWIRLDFGTYFLDSTDNFQTFKLSKNETKTSKYFRSNRTGK